ncbi:MAG: hypothetical protein ACWGPR_10875 [Candidatus Deferrimicrobiaceae bacterium]
MQTLGTYAICLWRYSQGIYRLDGTALEVLRQSPQPDIPWEALRLPENCLYFDMPSEDTDIVGFFVCVDSLHDPHVLSVTVVIPREYAPADAPAFSANPFITLQWVRDRDTLSSIHGGDEFLIRHTGTLLSCVLLLCQDEPDITDGGGLPTQPAKRLAKRGRDGTLYYPLPKRPLVYNVGRRMGDELRRVYADAAASGREVAMHLRRGHWHHYWTGPKSQPEKRRLVPRFISPILVNRTNPGDVPWEPRERIVKPADPHTSVQDFAGDAAHPTKPGVNER